ncbi:DNA polymerase eta [Neocloeon triangulifer]|uniref:DNA polymerase eta n=1 Tax=Neocloeon triangulifer TaxID=2078957 RepID=UPI00286EC433|nr:DNA polymerase eta [Neocloeon triangulifer]
MSSNMRERIVALIDMDCFYCQVETRINPELKGKPLAVVQYNKWRGGGIIAVNYEARACGVTRSMRGDEAKAKCPDINLVHVPSINEKADISKYRDAGKEVINVICQFSSAVQRASVDEAFLDLTEAVDKRMNGNTQVSVEHLMSTHVVGFESKLEDKEQGRTESVKEWLSAASSSNNEHDKRLVVASKMLEEMRAAILSQTGFTCSAGIAHNKILSKLICGLHKPNQQTVLPISRIAFLYETLPVKKVRHLGGKLGDVLVEKLGITYMCELEKFSEAELCQKFEQKNGQWLYNIARGIDHEQVESRLIPKSIGCCKRFPGKTSLKTKQEIEHWVNELASEVSLRLEKDNEENCRRPRNLVVQWSAEIGASNSKTGFLSHYDQESIAKDAMMLLSKSIAMDNNNLKVPCQFLGINVGRFTEEPNKANSIAKFFKASSKDIPMNRPHEPAERQKIGEPSQKLEEKKGKISSFFLQYAKNKDQSKPPEKVKPEQKTEKIEAVDEDPEIADEEEINSYVSSQDASSEASCPQCGAAVTLLKMSEHLDHHIAQELHKQLNQASAVHTAQPSSSVVAVNVNKKRKYTKSNNENTNSKKTRSIQSFFTQK